MYNRNFYGIDPYMYDDPYTILAQAQEGLEMPIEADYKSYPAYKEAYANWVALNRPQPVDTIPVQTPSSVLLQQSPKPVSKSKRALSSYEGPSVIDFLTSQGVSSDYKTRAALAKALGISNYTRKADQNLLMIDMIRKNPEILDLMTSQSYGAPRKSKKSKGLPSSPNETEDSVIEVGEDESGNKIVIDSTGNKLTVDSLGNVINIDSSRADTASKSDLTFDTTGTLPLPKGKKVTDTGGASDITKAIAGMAAIAAAGGLGYASFKDAEKAAEQLSKTSGVSADLLKSTFKKVSPKIKSAVKAYENMGLGAQEIYNELERLIAEDEEVAKAAFRKNVKKASKIQPLSTYTPEELKQFEEFKKQATPEELIELRKMERESGLSKVKSAPSLPKPKVPSSVSRAAKTSPSLSRMAKFEAQLSKNLPKVASGLRKTSNFIKGLRRFKFQEGGESQNAQMDQIMEFVATELQRGTSKPEIIEKLISVTQGSIDERSASELVDSVANQIMGGISEQMSQTGEEETGQEYTPIPDEQMMAQEQYAYGGGYSGTYDAGSGSYFQMGGSFVPTYGDILPEYMYGAMMQEGGTYGVGDTIDVSPEEMEYLRQQGYDFDVV